MITLQAVGYATVTLPDDLFWSDEFAWSPVASSLEYSTTGAALIDVGTKLSGRPMTLAAEENTCWTTRSTVDALKVMADVAGLEITLTIYTKTYTVIFAPGEKPFDAEPVWQEMPVAIEDKYELQAVRFITI